MAPKKQYHGLKYEQEVGRIIDVGTASMPESVLAKNGGKGTYYGGLMVSGGIKRQLETQPAAELLYFTPQLDGSYIMNAKLPDVGSFEVGYDYGSDDTNQPHSGQFKEIPVSSTVNCVVKAMQRGAPKTADMQMDLVALSDHYNEMLGLFIEATAAPNDANRYKAIEDKLFPNIWSEKEKRNVKALLETGAANPAFMKHLEHSLEQIDNILYLQGSLKDAELGAFAERQLDDCKNVLANMKAIDDMDLGHEKAMMLNLDCRDYGYLNTAMVDANNRYRKSHDLPTIGEEGRTGRQEIYIEKSEQGKKVLAEKGEINFGTHVAYTVPVNINGKDQLLSIESSAPTTEQAIFQPGSKKTGLGLYENSEDLNKYYCDNCACDINKVNERLAYGKRFFSGSDPERKKLLETRTMSARELDATVADGKADKLKKELADNTSFLRGSSNRYRAMEAALKTYPNDPAPGAVRAAAESYLLHKVGENFLDADLGRFNSYERKRIQSAREVMKFAEEECRKLEEQKAKVNPQKQADLKAAQHEVGIKDESKAFLSAAEHMETNEARNKVEAAMKAQALQSARALANRRANLLPEEIREHVTNINAYRAGKKFFDGMSPETEAKLDTPEKVQEYVSAIKESYKESAKNELVALKDTEGAANMINNIQKVKEAATRMVPTEKNKLEINEEVRKKNKEEREKRAAAAPKQPKQKQKQPKQKQRESSSEPSMN